MQGDPVSDKQTNKQTTTKTGMGGMAQVVEHLASKLAQSPECKSQYHRNQKPLKLFHSKDNIQE
jgi:hypothetical protein